MRNSQSRSGRIGERGSAVVAVLILLSAALLVVVGARLFGRAGGETLRCQAEAVRAIGSTAAPRCDSAGRTTVARFAPSPAGAGDIVMALVRFRQRSSKGRPSLSDASEREEEVRARETLEPLFQIIESGTDAAAQNQVTADEFEDVVHLYRDLRLGRTQIEITDRRYWNTIMAELALILQTEGGRELVGRLSRHSRQTFISVMVRRDENGDLDPELRPDNSGGFAWDDGLSGHVTYAPGGWTVFADADVKRDPWTVLRGDVVLYHELVHALDFHDGTRADGQIQVAHEDVRANEARAVGIGPHRDEPISENAYRAARREIGDVGIGAEIGDTDMPDRPQYDHRIPPAGPPGPGPPPAGDR